MTLVVEEQDVTPPRRAARWLPVALGLALVALVAGVLLGRGLDSGPADVTDDVSVGFVQDMKVHHAQAVEMAAVLHRRTTDPELGYLAFDILTTQQGQIGMMTGWLDLWGERQSGSGQVMAWMGHDGPMPGMATADQVAALGTLPVPEMETEFLRLMLAHHRGALDMASAAAEHAESVDVAALARSMYEGQSAEIALMERMLAERGAAPAAEGGHAHH